MINHEISEIESLQFYGWDLKGTSGLLLSWWKLLEGSLGRTRTEEQSYFLFGRVLAEDICENSRNDNGGE